MALVTLALTLAYKMGRRTYGKEGRIAKMREARQKSEAIKFENLRQKFEKCKIEPKQETKGITKNKTVEKNVQWSPFKYEP